MKKPTKLILSEQNHRVFYCTKPEFFEKLFKDPYQMIQMINDKELDFQMELGKINDDAEQDGNDSDENDYLANDPLL